MSAHRTWLLALGVLVPLSTTPAAAGAPGLGAGMAALDDDGPRKESADYMWARAKRSSITGLSVTYREGARAALPRKHGEITLGELTLVQSVEQTSPQSNNREFSARTPSLVGHLRIPAQPADGDPQVIRLAVDGIPGVRATLRLGRAPRIAIAGLPADVVNASFRTTGKGRAVIRDVAPCVNGKHPGRLRSVATFATGEQHVAAFDTTVNCKP